MTSADATATTELARLALGKLTRVLGEDGARRAFDAALEEARLTRIDTADDLYAFAETLTAMGGMEGAVGGLLSVAAVLRGASTRPAAASGEV